ncbi:MAG: DUF11 domain-containing protein [Verrucomicrobia bacterium]|nr:DUF11 domain-containing protein [Verrucomicrobiota bacterium]
MVNGEFIYRIRVDARTHLANVRVVEHLPYGVTFVRANPVENSLTSDQVRWEIDRMAAGSHRTFEVVVTPTREGAFDTCTIVTADPVVCLTMIAGQARLELTKTGPFEVELNQTATFVITVTNVGSAPHATFAWKTKCPQLWSPGAQPARLLMYCNPVKAGPSAYKPRRTSPDNTPIPPWCQVAALKHNRLHTHSPSSVRELMCACVRRNSNLCSLQPPSI